MIYSYEPLKTPARLYIKQCPHCGLKYFGRSTRRNVQSYTGSGKRWLGHLRKHKVNSIHLWNSKWYHDTSITRFALKFSKMNNIVESSKWANMILEDGMHQGIKPKLTPEQYKKISEKTRGVSRPWVYPNLSTYISKIQNGDIVNPHTKRWKITDPNGVIHIVDGMTSFCKEHKISAGNLGSLGKTKGYTAECLGYTKDFIRNHRYQGEDAEAASR